MIKDWFWFCKSLYIAYKSSEKGLEEAKIYSTVTDLFCNNLLIRKLREKNKIILVHISFDLVVFFITSLELTLVNSDHCVATIDSRIRIF